MEPDSLLPPDLGALFDGAPCGLVVTLTDGTIQKANTTFSSLIGFRQEELVGKRFQELLTMGGRIFHQTHWAPLMKMQGSVAEVKLDLVRSDDSTITMLLNGVRREHKTGVFHELALFGTTDRDKYEKELLKARRLAEESLAKKIEAEMSLQEAQEKLRVAYEAAQRRALFAEQMIAIVSHDLKNPMTAIKMASDFLSQGERSPKDTKMIGHIRGSADRAQRMIYDLLDFALARVGRRMAVTPKPVDLQRVAKRSIKELRITFPAALLSLNAEGEGLVTLDADRVQQVIGNLVANAVAYGDRDRPITVTSRIDEYGARLSVQNFGNPIPSSTLATLFEPMTRGVGGDSEARSVGLGLFIVNEIVAAHDGSVSVASTEEAGTIFTVEFPAFLDHPPV